MKRVTAMPSHQPNHRIDTNSLYKGHSISSRLFFSVSTQWQLKTKTIMKLYCHYCT